MGGLLSKLVFVVVALFLVRVLVAAVPAFLGDNLVALLAGLVLLFFLFRGLLSIFGKQR